MISLLKRLAGTSLWIDKKSGETVHKNTFVITNCMHYICNTMEPMLKNLILWNTIMMNV